MPEEFCFPRQNVRQFIKKQWKLEGKLKGLLDKTVKASDWMEVFITLFFF